MSSTDNKSVKSFVYGIIAGGVAGAISALLLAPKSGKELRHDIAEGAQQAGERTVKIARQTKEATGRIVQQVGDYTADLTGKVKKTAGNVIGDIRSKRSTDQTATISAVAEEEAQNDAYRATDDEASEQLASAADADDSTDDESETETTARH
ncbi:YtxH domain-containing protein [Paenibacillaceae bacterium]|nr:YtxH domain-containing protein [Paenibacillaceae bacterium]